VFVLSRGNEEKKRKVFFLTKQNYM